MALPSPASDLRPPASRYLVPAGLALLGLFLLRSSWMGDDAYIMLRVVRNLAEGHGMVYNIGERVNPASDPLWALLLALVCGPAHEYFLLPQLLDLALTFGAILGVIYAFRLPDSGKLLFLALCLGSKAFIDYSTAGLENALMYTLTAMLLHQTLVYPEGAAREGNTHYPPRRLFVISLLGSLLALCRPDAILLAGLPVAYAFYHAVWRAKSVRLLQAAAMLVLGGVPLLAWHAFSLVYYGMPFPNTYYAKVLVMRNSLIPLPAVLMQGVLYIINLIENDLATALMLVLAVGLALRQASVWVRVWGLTILLYTAYVVYIGGDFMSGRFFAVPALVAAVLLARHPADMGSKAALGGLVLLLACLRALPIYTYGDGHKLPLHVDRRGIADERSAYWQGAGLFSNFRRSHAVPDFVWYRYGTEARRYSTRVAKFLNIGMFGFAIQPDTYVIDPFGLTDNFLARLPLQGKRWRVGHYLHAMPAGFLQSKVQGGNHLQDPKLAALYTATQLLARGPLFTAERWQAIYDINTGRYDKGLKGYFTFAAQDTLPGGYVNEYIDFYDTRDPRVKPIFEEPDWDFDTH